MVITGFSKDTPTENTTGSSTCRRGNTISSIGVRLNMRNRSTAHQRLLSLVSHLALMFPNCILLFVPIMTAPTCLFSIWCTLLSDFQASLKRVVAGLKVIVKKEDNGLFGSEIAKMQIFIHDIAEKINFYTAEPENMSKTVKFDLVASADGTSMSNATVMLFPSAATPQLELMITTRDGQTQTLSKNLTSTLSANTRLTLNIIIKDPNPGGSVTGNFSIENWKEASETIEFTMEN